MRLSSSKLKNDLEFSINYSLIKINCIKVRKKHFLESLKREN
jgi:hypothetical protein